MLQPEDAEMQKSAAGLRAKAGQGSVQDILQLFKDADISEFVLMSRESSVAINPEAKSSDFLEQTDSEKGSPGRITMRCSSGSRNVVMP